MRIVIPSRGRARTISDKALRLFPDALVCVHQREVDSYARALADSQLLAHDVEGLGVIRQWILDHVDERVIVMADDDVAHCWSVAGAHARRLDDPVIVRQVLETSADCAEAAGARLFGFNQGSIVKYRPQEPFKFDTWVGGVIGIIGRELRYDPVCRLHDDIDLCLQSLLKHRIIWQDQRFVFGHAVFSNTGGNAAARSTAQHDREIAYLQRKWGAHLTPRATKGTVRLVLKVERSRSHALDT